MLQGIKTIFRKNVSFLSNMGSTFQRYFLQRCKVIKGTHFKLIPALRLKRPSRESFC